MSALRKKDLRLTPAAAERELVKAALRLTRLQAMRRALAKRTRALDADIRTAKRDLKALVSSVAEPDPFDQAPPLRQFGESQD